MAHVKVRGIILRLVNVKDYDRYITLLTRDMGVVSVFAKRLRRPKNPLSGRCQLFSFADFNLFAYKGRYTLDDAEVVYSFKNLQSDIFRISAASQLAAMIIDHVHEKEEAAEFYELFVRACYELDIAKKDPYMITWLAQMKMMNYMGYQPQLDVSIESGKAVDEEREIFFDYRRAGLLGAREGRAAIEQPGRAVSLLSPELLLILRFLEKCPPERTFSLNLPQPLIDELGRFTLRYLGEHLDKSYDKFTDFKSFSRLPKDPSDS